MVTEHSELDPGRWDERAVAEALAANAATAGAGAVGSYWALAGNFPFSLLAGSRALEHGGSAADAFVTMALCDVVMTGASTLAGYLKLVVHQDGVTSYLDGGFRAPLQLEAYSGLGWEELTQTGKAVLVPGMPAALDVLHRRWGRLDWAELVRPAQWLAREGFPAYPRFAQLVVARSEMLLRSPQGRDIFAPQGRLLAENDLFRQPQLADTLAAYAAMGRRAFYQGNWAEDFLGQVNAEGGALTADDLTGYGAGLCQPLAVRYQDWEIHTVPPPAAGGVALAIALRVAEELGLHKAAPRWLSGRTLALEAAALAQAHAAQELLEPGGPDDVLGYLRGPEPARLARKIVEGTMPAPRAKGVLGTHSLAVTDAEGLTIAGSHSINWTAWGIGLFVGGVCLNAGGHNLDGAGVGPGQPLGGAVCPYVATRGEDLWAASGTSTGLVPASFQFAIDTLGRGQDAGVAISSARWGERAFDPVSAQSSDAWEVEDGFADGVLAEARAAGQAFRHKADPALGYLSCVGRSDYQVVGAGDPRFRGGASAR